MLEVFDSGEVDVGIEVDVNVGVVDDFVFQDFGVVGLLVMVV